MFLLLILILFDIFFNIIGLNNIISFINHVIIQNNNITKNKNPNTPFRPYFRDKHIIPVCFECLI